VFTTVYRCGPEVFGPLTIDDGCFLEVVIANCRNKRTREFADGKQVKTSSGFEQSARLKLDRMAAATSMSDLVASRGSGPRGVHKTKVVNIVGHPANFRRASAGPAMIAGSRIEITFGISRDLIFAVCSSCAGNHSNASINDANL
jgi:hypothetical protein